MDRSTARPPSRRVLVDVAPNVSVTVHEVADTEAFLRTAAERPHMDPYARVLWPAALAAAREVAATLKPGQRILDVCAGTGLVSLTAAKLGARTCALDHDASALAAIRDAAREQALELKTLRFDIASSKALPAADIVVFADVLYQAQLATAVARRTLEAVESGARVLVADPGRVGRVTFDEILEKAGLTVEFRSTMVRHPNESEDTLVELGWFGS